MGRIPAEQRIINGASAFNNVVKYSYYKDGELNTLTYPGSGRVVTYTANSSGGLSAGRPVSVADTAHSINYVTSATYAPQGALASFTNGASIKGAFSYNSRLQPLQVFYGTNTPPSLTASTCPSTVGNIMHRVYNFSVGTNDNGNVVSITNCRDTNRTQSFTYDSLNRIETAATQGATCTSCWGQMFGHMSGSTFVPGIDAWGNLHEITVTQGSATGLNQAVTNNNQFVGMTYDAAGNVINDGAGNSYGYDGENELTYVSGAGVWTYIYDGDGQRVAKCTGQPCTSTSNGQLYWRNLSGGSLVETGWNSGSGNQEYIFFGGKRTSRRSVSTGAVYYSFADHLGSTSVIASATGVVQQQSDYYPFGGEVVVSGSTFNNYRFTGKERDGESGLDYFGARHYTSAFGRFVQPDWATKPTAVPYAMLGDPQTLNLYGYVRNNPISKADIDGHCYPWCTAIGGFFVGGLIGGGGEIIAEKLQGKSIDWKKVEGSAFKGAVTGAAIGIAGPEGGVAATAALGAGGNVAGGIADRTIQGQSVKDVLSPTAVAKDAASGAFGGAIGAAKIGEAAGEFVAQESAKVAVASGDQAAASFYSNNASAIGTGVAKAIDLGQSTAESYQDQSNKQERQPKQAQQNQTNPTEYQ